MLMSVLTLNPYDFSAQQISTLKTAPPYGGKTPSPSIMQLFEPKKFTFFVKHPTDLRNAYMFIYLLIMLKIDARRFLKLF